MQIHELNNFTGTLGSGAYLAVDDGNDTGKLSTQQLLAATEARIDNIIAGPAPSAQEVTDARRGADGVTYSSLGTSIRSQVTDVKSALNDCVSEYGENLYDFNDLWVAATADGWALTGDGHCDSKPESKLVKYKVAEGQVLYLSLSADDDGTYQFQSNASVPPPPYSVVDLIGAPISGAVKRVVVVPKGATYLIVSQSKTNTTNKVKRGIYTIKQHLNKIALNNIVFDKTLFTEFDRIIFASINGYSSGRPTYSLDDGYVVELTIPTDFNYLYYHLDTSKSRGACKFGSSTYPYDTSNIVANLHSEFEYDSSTDIVKVNLRGFGASEYLALQIDPNDTLVFCNREIDATAIDMPVKRLISASNLKSKSVGVNTLDDELRSIIGASGGSVITVKKDGTGDYTSLVSALSAVASDSDNDYIVEIYEGTYTISDEWTDTELANANYPNGFYGTIIPSNCDVIGVGDKEKIIINAESNNNYSWDTTWTHISTLNVKGGSTIKNVTVKCKGLRYAIHDDFSDAENATTNYIDCIIDKWGSQEGNALGCGSHNNEIINIEGCIIKPAMVWHGHNPASAGATLNIKDSIIENCLNLQDYLTGYAMPVNLINVHCNAIVYSKYVANATQYMRIKMYGNNVPVICSEEAIYDMDGIEYKMAYANIAKGKPVKRTDYFGTVEAMVSSDSASKFYGVTMEAIPQSVYNSTDYVYGRVITSGYVSSLLLGLSGLSVGDKIGINNGAFAVVTENAIGVINYVVDSIGYMRIY